MHEEQGRGGGLLKKGILTVKLNKAAAAGGNGGNLVEWGGSRE